MQSKEVLRLLDFIKIRERTKTYHKHFTVCFPERRNTPTPTVVIIGWIGSSQHQLSKYTNFYNNKLNCTVIYTKPPDYYHFFPRKLRDFARQLLMLIKELDLDSNPLFFHVFSGNMTIYSHVVDLMTREGNFFELRDLTEGSIFDSAPNNLTKETAYLGLSMGSNSTLYRGIIWSACSLFDSLVDAKKSNKFVIGLSFTLTNQQGLQEATK